MTSQRWCLTTQWLKIEVGVDEQAINVEVLDSHGGNHNPKGINQHSKEVNGSETTINQQDRGKSYLLRRMARDFPEALGGVNSNS